MCGGYCLVVMERRGEESGTCPPSSRPGVELWRTGGSASFPRLHGTDELVRQAHHRSESPLVFIGIEEGEKWDLRERVLPEGLLKRREKN